MAGCWSHSVVGRIGGITNAFLGYLYFTAVICVSGTSFPFRWETLAVKEHAYGFASGIGDVFLFGVLFVAAVVIVAAWLVEYKDYIVAVGALSAAVAVWQPNTSTDLVAESVQAREWKSRLMSQLAPP